MLALVRRARRRLLQNELIAQAANASSAALIVLILLLLLGTEILSWQFVILIPVLALAAGLYFTKRRLPGAYRVAQIVDRRLGLADTISTALYYRESGAKGSPEIVRLQAEEAERMAASADVERALPYTMPRAAYAVAALFVVAGSLFALRYGIERRLDLKAPLASILRQSLGIEPKQENAKAKTPKVPRPDIAPDSELASAEERIRAADPNGNSDQADESEIPGKVESRKVDGASQKSQDGQAQAESDQQEAGNEDRPGNDGENANSGQQGKQEGKQGKQKDGNNSGDNNSLMSKVKDAVQNLLSRMKPQQNQQNGQQQGEQNGQQQKGQQNGSKQQSAKNGQQQGGQQSEGQDGQSGEQAQNSQEQQGKSQGNSDSKQASKQPGSGVGSQDGDKATKQAEQLAAMGKISEIIGKRSQTLTGETTVEVQQSNNQPLKTQYTNRVAQHTQGGAEINRDEVPVALQSYVESYFEQVRKQPAPKK